MFFILPILFLILLSCNFHPSRGEWAGLDKNLQDNRIEDKMGRIRIDLLSCSSSSPSYSLSCYPVIFHPNRGEWTGLDKNLQDNRIEDKMGRMRNRMRIGLLSCSSSSPCRCSKRFFRSPGKIEGDLVSSL